MGQPRFPELVPWPHVAFALIDPEEADEKHRQHEGAPGESDDPEKFDVDVVNERLKGLR